LSEQSDVQPPTPLSEPAAEAEAASQPSEVEIQASRVAGALRRLSPEATVQPARNYVSVLVPTDQLEAAALILRDELGYALLSMVTAVDYPDRIEVIYLAFALDHPHGAELRTHLPRVDLPDCPSLTSVWPGADFQERETYDMMGINFVGHPDLRRILTDDNFPGHPLRKDFSIDPDYVLMRHLRYGVEGQLKPKTEEREPPLPNGAG
jgi:NADH:ubiquinone oxidoreductase subunit C